MSTLTRSNSLAPWRTGVRLVPDPAATEWPQIRFATPSGELPVREWLQRTSPWPAARLSHILELGGPGAASRAMAAAVRRKRFAVRVDPGWAPNGVAAAPRGATLRQQVRARAGQDPEFADARRAQALPLRIGATVATLRASARLTQEAVAAAAGVVRCDVASCECGYVLPRTEYLAALVRACGYTLEIRLLRNGRPAPEVPPLRLAVAHTPMAGASAVRAWLDTLMLAVRARLGPGTSRVARRLGAHPYYVYKLERRVRSVTLPTIARLAEAIGAETELRILATGGQPTALVSPIRLHGRA
jgi:transcriptional regulator with XRE-family HTH domain